MITVSVMKGLRLRIFTAIISANIFEIFNIKKNCSRNLMMSKNRVENEMIIICKDCCDFVQRIFYLVKRNYFNEIKKMFGEVLLEKFRRKKRKDKIRQF